MDHIKILKRAFSITWNYKVLWLFGILLALTTARGGGNGGGDGNHGNSGASLPSNGIHPPQFNFPIVSQDFVNAMIVAGIGLLCLVLLLVIVGVTVHYVSETALIRMVDQYEATGEKVGVSQGFRLGWNRAALRMFLIDLLVGLGLAVVILLGLLIASAPLLVWLTGSTPLKVLGTVLAIGLTLIVIFIAILLVIALSLLRNFFHRACALENLGVFEGIRRGAQLVRQRLGDVIIMGLILFAMGLGALIVIIPVAILVILAATVSGGLPGLLVGALASLFTNGALPWILAALVAVPIFLLVFIAPLAFLGGLIETFQSSTWTLTYREAMALVAAKKEVVPEEGALPEESDKPEESGPAENAESPEAES